ncbi:hypothetical protein KC19_12G125000 [Ceratodon purpureus]|uniref:Protein kinase domain-containing protein n=1 Tax=Ceratodon purpureus TaxID=3225 RepID=A0A8T0GC82_CERPU|nr:hypothetical protein KC19_12G125000 [Ceratodon purpureus]
MFVEAVTPEAVKATFVALNVVHEFGIFHGDIRCNIILVVKRGQGGVRLIDIGFSPAVKIARETEHSCKT